MPERGYELELLSVLPIRGAGVSGALRGIARAAARCRKRARCSNGSRRSAVFSIGGYAAGPVSLAARSLGVPLALMEPNSVIGLANRLIAPLVQRAYTAFPESEKHFKRAVVLRAGVPIRAGFAPRPYEPRLSALRMLVLGGSQGAKSLNEAGAARARASRAERGRACTSAAPRTKPPRALVRASSGLRSASRSCPSSTTCRPRWPAPIW